MNNLKCQDYFFSGLSKINLIVGKNGSGKSTLLRNLDASQLEIDNQVFTGAKKYVSPERGGAVVYQANVEQNMADVNWLTSDRRKNQATGFRQQSAAIFRQLETNILRIIEKDPNKRSDHSYSFDTYINDINALLGQIRIQRSSSTFEIFHKTNGTQISAESISSGESELISLSIECLAFEASNTSTALLILDEPDVHLHPDLQSKFMNFLHKIVSRSEVKIILSTHSTPVLGALSDKDSVTVCFMNINQKNLVFKEINSVIKGIVPIFGAHPLTQVFNNSPILIVEGTDEERIWQQVVRSSIGRIKLFPVECGGKSNMSLYEIESSEILKSIYDDAKGFSIRDGDGEIVELADIDAIIRLRLKCYASENLMLTDECLSSFNISWNEYKEKINMWKSQNLEHRYYTKICDFIDGGYDRKNFNLKDIRNILLSLLPTNKPWEVLVGQTLAAVVINESSLYALEGSILNFLGEKICINILKH